MEASGSRTPPLRSSTEHQGEEATNPFDLSIPSLRGNNTVENESNIDEMRNIINIFLKVVRTVALRVKRSETIKDLKALLRDKYGYAENHQELFLGGDMLMDCRSLVECGVQRDSTLHLILQNNVEIKLFVKLPSGQSPIEIEAKVHDTIRNIKSMSQAKKKMIPLNHFTLFFGGQLLEEDSTLASLGIKDKSTLQVILAPKDNLSISVKAPSGQTIKLKVKALFTVSDVKSIVGNVTGISMISVCNLIYAGKKLEDHKTLAFYDIRDDYVLEMAPRLFQILVKSFDGRTITIDGVKQSDAVEDVKVKVFCKLNMPMEAFDHWRLLFGRKDLRDGQDLASYNIQKDSTLILRYANNPMCM